MNENANSPAYPLPDSQGIEDNGLTKREYFAALAMQGLLADGETAVSRGRPEGQLLMTRMNGVPKLAVEFADGLLAALED